MDDVRDLFLVKVKVLNETIWEDRVSGEHLNAWLESFAPDSEGAPSEREHALHLASQFMYFGLAEMRELLKALYRDLYKYPLVASLRKRLGHTSDEAVLKKEFDEQLMRTRFLGVGNPSESGCHLLYYFRQENALPRELFIHAHQIFARHAGRPALRLRFPEVQQYVFIDDLCASGTQACQYSRDILEDVKRLGHGVRACYYALFGTSAGMRVIRGSTLFDEAKCIFELDSSYQCFSDESRYFIQLPGSIDKAFSENMCSQHGQMLWPEHPLGYKDGQLLLGFHHNTPDNTLPVIWHEGTPDRPWTPIFRRYPKFYGWGTS